VKRVLVAALVALAAAPAHAQPAEALGKPLMAPNLPVGTVTVRVIVGDIANVAAGHDVTLVVNGAPRTARTDAEGRATFSGLPAGATVQAKIAGADGAEVASEQFAIPGGGGAALMLSTKPPAAGAAMPAAGGGGGGGPQMPQPRQISGVAREEPADPPGMLTVLVTYADLLGQNPPGQPVYLVGYSFDDRVIVLRDDTDASGRAEFTDLDISGDTVYYAMTLLPRGAGYDRLISPAIQPTPGVGLRMVLSGETRTSTQPPLDDLGRLEAQLPNIPGGTVAVAVLARQPDDGATIELVEAATGKVLQNERVGRSADAGMNANSRFGGFEPDDATPPGSLRVFAISGDGRPLPDTTVTLVPAEAGPTPPAPLQTDASGKVTFTGVTPGQWRVVLQAGRASGESEPIAVPADKGGRVVGILSWFEGIPPRLVQLRGVPATPDPLFVRLRGKGGIRKSLPFQPLADRGSTAPFELGPQLVFAFGADGSVDDRYLGFSGRFTIGNMWSTPYKAGDDGLLIKLPAGHVGGVVGEEDQKWVAPEAYEGFRIRRAIKPGESSFVAGFSLPIDDGTVEWKLDLPYGATQSRIALLDHPGMRVMLPGGAVGTCDVNPQTGQRAPQCKTAPNGLDFYLVDDIEIGAGQSMVMKVTGLPNMPAWKIWMPRLAGLIVLALITLTVVVVLRARRAGQRGAGAARIQELMTELVEMERKGQGGKRKEALLAELEALWDADGPEARAARAAGRAG
jgi:hypothetical protein